MNIRAAQHASRPGTTSVRAIRIAVLAMGGEGGGVLANWLVELAEANGHLAQMTSVPGVAQRTGATIYYVEMFPDAELNGREPVLALMPVPGDVDIVIASELMEAGRAIQRGIVTPDRTVLIASTHRVFAIAEKIALADGRADESALIDAARAAAARLVSFDMQAVAEKTGSVISAVLFGALAASGALPFDRAAFETTIDHGGVGVAASKRAFAAGYDTASGRQPAIEPVPLNGPLTKPADEAGLAREAARLFAPAALQVITAGIARCLDFQDLAYAALYVERLKPIADMERLYGDGSAKLLTETARYLALGMTFEDPIRVADLKIRSERIERVAAEVGARHDQILQIREYMHPRLQEIAETVPAGLGRFLLKNKLARTFVQNLTSSGRIIESTSIRGFVLLYAVARMKPWRRRSMRFQREQVDLSAWLATVAETATRDCVLATEVAELRNLVKGYGDTHARGAANYAAIMAIVPDLKGPAAATELASYRTLALADDTGVRLGAAIAQRLSRTQP
jgi:indolepyruvate ferredoxin oxidoreductase beta subunit